MFLKINDKKVFVLLGSVSSKIDLYISEDNDSCFTIDFDVYDHSC